MVSTGNTIQVRPAGQTLQYGQPASTLIPVPVDRQNVKQISQSLVAQHRNRNLIGNGGNEKQFGQPMDSLSIGLNSNFSKNLKDRDHSQQVPHVSHNQMASITHNPLNEGDMEERKI